MGIKDGLCPNCGSNLIYSNQRKKTYNYASVILVRVNWWYKHVSLCHYVCASCGYTESYIADADSMKVVVEEFEPLNKEKRKNHGS